MKYKVLNKSRLVYLVLAIVLLIVSMVPMAMAQEPDVAPAFTMHGAPGLRPNPLTVTSALGGTSDLFIRDIEDIFTAELVVDFPTAAPVLLNVANVEAGDLLNNLVLGTHYQLQWCVVDFAACPDPLPGTAIGPGDNRLSINLALFGYASPLQGNGSLARIRWGTTAVGPGGGPNITWQTGDFRDRDGNIIQPCSVLGAPWPPECLPGLFFPIATPVSVEAAGDVIRAQAVSEGGKPPGNPPLLEVDAVDPVGGGVTACPFGGGHFSCPPGTPLPSTVTATRTGYLGARATNVLAEDLPQATLIAGNVVTGGPCEVINIADIAAIAGELYQTIVSAGGTAPDEMDFNNDGTGTVDIGDLALAAKNFGKRGTIDWRTGQLSCP